MGGKVFIKSENLNHLEETIVQRKVTLRLSEVTRPTGILFLISNTTPFVTQSI